MKTLKICILLGEDPCISQVTQKIYNGLILLIITNRYFQIVRTVCNI